MPPSPPPPRHSATPETTATNPASGAAPQPSRPRPPRAWRGFAWGLTGLLTLLLALLAAGWWWSGTEQSLAATLTRAARHLPVGQTLETREVSGSLRAGGRIGFLRWQSPTLAVEVRQAQIGWQLAPLWHRRLQLDEVRAAQVLIEKRGPGTDQPLAPLESLALPLDVELPFRIDELRWSGPPALVARQLAGRYGYAADQHTLAIDGVDVAEGHYSARATLQGPAPMALDAALEGRVRAPLAEDHAIDVLADAQLKGTLAGHDARLQVQAQLRPAEQDAEAPMQAQLAAHLAPWRKQPVIDAKADLQRLDLARLWPGAPQTQLTGDVLAGPDAASGADAWQLRIDLRNAQPGPWDTQRLPLEAVDAQVAFDGQRWRVPSAQILAGHGRIEAEGEWSPAPAPWQLQATLRNVRPGELHTTLAGAALTGRASAEQRGEALHFDLALQAQGGAAARERQGLKLERLLAQGEWQDQVLELRQLRVEAERARIDGQLQVRVAEQAGHGQLKLALPGATAQLEGRLTATKGGGQVKARIDDAAALQQWIERLPGQRQRFAGASAQGTAGLDAQWQGGWQALQRRLQHPDQPAAPGQAEPSLKATLNIGRLDLQLPPDARKAVEAALDATAAAVSAASRPATPAHAPSTLQLRHTQAEFDGSLAQASLNLRGEVAAGTRQFKLDTRASGGLAGPRQWRATVAHLSLQMQDNAQPGAPWALELERALTGQVRTGASLLELDTSAGAASLRGPVPGTVRLDWEPLRLRQTGTAPHTVFRLQSKGRLQGLPMAWAGALSRDDALGELGIGGDLVFDGDWDIDAADTLRARARLARASGDLRVQTGEAALVRRIHSRGTGTPREITTDSTDQAPATPAGLREAELRLEAEGDTVRARLSWDSLRAGTLRAEASTRLLQRGDGWQWAPDAPLAGRITARLPQLGAWSMLAPPGWRVAGTLEADATLSGHRAEPRWHGTLAADQLALRAVVEGLDLRDGRLRATLAGNRVQVTEFTLRGGAGSSARIAGQSGNRSTHASEAATDGGSLSARGELRWGAAPAPGASATGLHLAMQGELHSLRALVRSDRQITLSGQLQARLEGGQLSLGGKLRADRAVIILPDETAPGLGSDVVIHSAAKTRQAREEAARQAARGEAAHVNPPLTAKPPDLHVTFDLGDDFAVQGRGLTSRLEGQLDLRSNSLSAPPRLTGEVRTVHGQYRAYGQQLDVETGVARFNGPFDNPALDILAIRPNITQRAGVQITGSAQSPRVRLYSEPALSDAETLSWLVLGRASATSGGESVLLQQAALALLSGLGKNSSGGNLASRFGLDEIGFKGPGGNGDVRDSAITLGKRLSKDFYVTYERSLSSTLGTLFIFYDLTRHLTLRGQAGQQSGIDLIYTVQYD